MHRRQTGFGAHFVRDFPTMPFYTGAPWFLPLVGRWRRLSDRMAR